MIFSFRHKLPSDMWTRCEVKVGEVRRFPWFSCPVEFHFNYGIPKTILSALKEKKRKKRKKKKQVLCLFFHFPHIISYVYLPLTTLSYFSPYLFLPFPFPSFSFPFHFPFSLFLCSPIPSPFLFSFPLPSQFVPILFKRWVVCPTSPPLVTPLTTL